MMKNEETPYEELMRTHPWLMRWEWYKACVSEFIWKFHPHRNRWCDKCGEFVGNSSRQAKAHLCAQANAEFIANARVDVPRLLREVARQRDELAAARAALAACRAALYDFAHKTSVLPDSRHAALADKFAAEIEAAVAGTAALADAGRAGAEGG
jgi:hypothetical protein